MLNYFNMTYNFLSKNISYFPCKNGIIQFLANYQQISNKEIKVILSHAKADIRRHQMFTDTTHWYQITPMSSIYNI